MENQLSCDPTDGSNSRGITPWSDLEGKEIQEEIKKARENGDSANANHLEQINKIIEKIN